VVTHLTTNPPVQCLNMAERTGSLIFIVLWSYVVIFRLWYEYIVFSWWVVRCDGGRNRIMVSMMVCGCNAEIQLIE
jgi:hypothetical protein